VACAFCPAHLSAYAGVLSAMGVGVALDPRAHGAVLGASLAAALAASLWSARRTGGRWGPGLTLLGAALLLLSHFVYDHALLDGGGSALILLASATGARRSFRQATRAATAEASCPCGHDHGAPARGEAPVDPGQKRQPNPMVAGGGGA
jgi:hypothetical protein